MASLVGAALPSAACSGRERRERPSRPEVLLFRERDTGPETVLPPPQESVACRAVGEPLTASAEGSDASLPSMVWGPGVVALAYLRDDGSRSLVELVRLLDGRPTGNRVSLGEGAAREWTSIGWDGTSFVLTWGEPTDLVTEVFVGMVDAAGRVRWDPTRVTETLRTGRWRSPERTAVASLDARVLPVGDIVVLSWRTRTFPEAQPLFFAAVSGLEVSAPVIISGESDSVLDHQLVAWGDDVVAVYGGRFQRTQRLVRVARLKTSPPALHEDWLVADLPVAPQWFEVAAVAAGDDLLALWRTHTEWDSTSNVALARVPPDGPAASPPPAMPLENVRAATPPANQPRRTFAAIPRGDGLVVAWAVEGRGEGETPGELRIGAFDAAGRSLGEPARIPTNVRLARDPALAAGHDGEVWYAYRYGEPPRERGRILVGSVRCE